MPPPTTGRRLTVTPPPARLVPAALCLLALAAAPVRAEEQPPLKVLSRTLLHVKDNYGIPARIQPNRMLLAALEAMAKQDSQVAVDLRAAPQRATVTVSGNAKTFELDVGDVWKVSFVLKDVFAHVAAHARPGAQLDALERAATNGLLSTLDPHSALISPADYAEMKVQTKGEFGGLGVVIAMKEERLVVQKVLRNSPAARGGLVAGDAITQIGNSPTRGVALKDLVAQLRGPVGSEIFLTVERPGRTLPEVVRLTREVITIESVRSKLLPGNVGTIRIANFQGTTARQVAAALTSLSSEAASRGGKLQGVVLDLRGNPGGLLAQAVEVADLFVPEGLLIATVGKGTRDEKRAQANSPQGYESGPLAVLVDEGTASAAEILMGALEHRDRAVVLGHPTFGKGSAQVLYDLPDGGALKLTVAQYVLEGDEAFDGVGLAPDVALEPEGATRPATATRSGPPAGVTRATLRHAPVQGEDDDRMPLALAVDLLRATEGQNRATLLARVDGWLATAPARDANALVARHLGTWGAAAAQPPAPAPSVAATTPGPGTKTPALEPSAASDVDRAPVTKMQQDDAYAVVIGIERYRGELPLAEYAENDAKVFKAYLQRTLGVPDDHINLLIGQRASKSDIEAALREWLPARVKKPGSRVYFYFSGHGAPDPASGDSYLVPWDGEPEYLKSKALSVSSVYSDLGALRGARVVAFLDACFSGSGGRSVLSKGLRPLVALREEAPTRGAMAALVASSASQVSGPAEPAHHGLFTYHLLRGLSGLADRDTDRTVTLGELNLFVTRSVREDAKKANREQVPQLRTIGDKAASEWVLVDHLVYE